MFSGFKPRGPFRCAVQRWQRNLQGVISIFWDIFQNIIWLIEKKWWIMKIIIKCSLTLLTGFTHSDVTQLQQQMFGLVNVLFISPSGCIFTIQLVCLFFLYSFGYRLSHSTSLHSHFEHNFFAKKDPKKMHNKLFFFQIFYGYCNNIITVNSLGHDNRAVKTWHRDSPNTDDINNTTARYFYILWCCFLLIIDFFIK